MDGIDNTLDAFEDTVEQFEPKQMLIFEGVNYTDQVDWTCLDGMIEGEMPWLPRPIRLEGDSDFTNRCLHQLDELMRMLHLIHWKKALRLDQYKLQLGKRHCLRLTPVAICQTFYSSRWANHYAMSIYFVFTGKIDIESLTWVRIYPEFTLQDDITFIPPSRRKSEGIGIESPWKIKSKGVSGSSTGVTNPITMTITKPSSILYENNVHDGNCDVSPLTSRDSV